MPLFKRRPLLDGVADFSELRKRLSERKSKGSESPQKTLETISRWLKGLTPASNAFAKRMAAASAQAGSQDSSGDGRTGKPARYRYQEGPLR
jgi:hypothetical protein